MAITLESLHELLSAPGCQIFSDGDSTLVYRFFHRGQLLNADILIEEDGGYVRFLVPGFLNLYVAGDRTAMMLKLLELNRRYKLYKFSCDPEDGEVALSIELPLCDNTLTEEQVSRCMYLLTNGALQERDRLLTFQQTGIYPASDDPQFTESIERILGGSGRNVEAEESNSLFDLFCEETAAHE